MNWFDRLLFEFPTPKNTPTTLQVFGVVFGVIAVWWALSAWFETL